MCISCHFWDCQVLLGSSLIHVRSTVVWVSDLYLYFLKTGSMNKLHLSHITTSIKACIDTTVAVHTLSENVRCFATSSSLSPARLYPIAIRDSSTTKINVWTRRSTIETPRRQSFNRTLDQLIGSALQRWRCLMSIADFNHGLQVVVAVNTLVTAVTTALSVYRRSYVVRASVQWVTFCVEKFIHN